MCRSPTMSAVLAGARLALRAFPESYDMGRLAVYLASPECWLTGQTLFLDGGQIMHR